MYENLKELYSNHFKLAFDNNLLLNLRMFRLSWAQKDDEYMEFLGGNTLGTQNIRFSIKDDEGLIVDTLNMDINQLTYDLSNTKGITKGRAAETNVIYQTLVYLMHGFTKTSKLKTKEKEEAVKECFYIFAYKRFSSLMFHYFKFPTDESVAKAVYEKLSNKFLIKRLGSWQAVFEYRSRDLLPGNIHYKRLQEYETDDAIRIILDMQTKLNDMFKNIYSVTMDVYASNERVLTDSLVTRIEGEEGLKDINNSPDRHIAYIRSIIRSSSDFAKYDLANLVCSMFSKVSAQILYNFLVVLTEAKQEVLNEIIDVSVLKAIEALDIKGIRKDYNKQIVQVLDVVRLKFTNNKDTNREVVKVKKLLEKEFIKAFPKSKYIANTISACTLIYVFIRCLYKE